LSTFVSGGPESDGCMPRIRWNSVEPLRGDARMTTPSKLT